MGHRPRGRRSSVDRGNSESGIEPRRSQWCSGRLRRPRRRGATPRCASWSVQPGPAWSKTPCARSKPPGREPRDPRVGRREMADRSAQRTDEGTSAMNGSRKSDGCVVPGKPADKGGGAPSSVETVEGRRLVEGNPGQGPRDRTQSRADLNAPLSRIRQAARRDRRQRFTALWHHVYDVRRLEEAYRALNRKVEVEQHLEPR